MTRSHVTTHVLDAVAGRPAAGVDCRLEWRGDTWDLIAAGTTDADGRIADLGPEALPPGVYRVSFAVGEYFAAQERATFYPEITLVFEIADPAEHYHVPLLLSPYAFSTYRGS